LKKERRSRKKRKRSAKRPRFKERKGLEGGAGAEHPSSSTKGTKKLISFKGAPQRNDWRVGAAGNWERL